MGTVRLYYDELDSPIGPLLIIGNGEKIVRIDYGTFDDRQDEINTWAKRFLGNPVFIRQPDKVAYVKRELNRYFLGELQHFSFPFALFGTEFQKKVWQALLDEIPFGTTKSYKDIAIAIGKPKSVRAVGGAVKVNPFSIVVPCHRVIGTSGKMVGYNGGLDKKTYLLALEKKYQNNAS